MAVFQAGQIASAAPNVLFDPAGALQAASAIQRNAMLTQQGERAIHQADIEEAARAASFVLGQPPEARPAAWRSVVLHGQPQGAFVGDDPNAYPGDEKLGLLRAFGLPAADQYKMQADTEAKAGVWPGSGAQPAQAPPAGASPASVAPFVARNLPPDISPDEDAVVRTVYGEARGEPEAGQRGVARVIANRASQSGMTPSQVVFAHGQFEPWSDPKVRPQLEALDPASPEYQAILANVRKAPLIQDPTGGATHFYSPGAQTALGRSAPDWATGTPSAEIGGHRFYALGYQAPRGVAGRTGGTDVASSGQMPPGTLPAQRDDGVPAPASAAPQPGMTADAFRAMRAPGVGTDDLTGQDRAELDALARDRRVSASQLLQSKEGMQKTNRDTGKEYWKELNAHLPRGFERDPGNPSRIRQIEGVPPASAFSGQGVDISMMNSLLSLKPKMMDGSATPAERDQYELAWNHYRMGNLELGPDPSDPTGQRQMYVRVPRELPASFPTPGFRPGGRPAAAGAPAVQPGQPAPADGSGSPAAPRGAATPMPGTQRPKPVLTQDQSLAATYADRMRAADATMSKLDAAATNWVEKVGHAASSVIGYGLNSSDYQQVEQAQREFVNAVLRKESGAAIAASEFESAQKQYFPQPGDSAAVIGQKAEARQRSIAGLTREAGPLYQPGMTTPAAVRPAAVPPPPPGFKVVQ